MPEQAPVSTPLENAPLIELIAEVRWGAAPLQGSSPIQANGRGPTFITAPTNQLDEFFMRFGGAIHSAGYSETERLVPPGFPFMEHQAVYRFRSRNESGTKSLYQVGPGLFSANAVPPYESWSHFEPIVRKGVEAVIGARPQSEKDAPFLATNLRYIDAFGEALTGGRDIATFAEEVLGIQVSLPKAITQHLVQGGVPNPVLHFQIPMANGALMTVGIGQGLTYGKPAIMMDTSVSSTIEITPNVESVMAAFNSAHTAIHQTFEPLMKPIAHLMPPKRSS
jgi:uncharacterized protein (TIGR04255 family)